jgi:hypothetical protein
MPFGPTNGPAIFVNFIYDIDSVWKGLVKSIGIPVGDTTNIRITINNIVCWSSTEDYAIAYIQCQLKVYQAYRLSLNLWKSYFFPKQFEFVGADTCINGQHLNLFPTWQNSLALPSSTHDSSVTLS